MVSYLQAMQKISFKIQLDSMRLVPAGMMAIWAVQQSLALGSNEMYLQSFLLLGLVILFTLVSIWIGTRHGFITRFEMLIMTFLCFVMFSSILNGTDFKNWAYTSMAIFMPLLLFRYYRESLPTLLIGLLLGFSFSIYVGFVDLIAHPEKWLNLERGDSGGYLLGGNYNQMAPIIMCAVVINMLCLKISRWFWLTAIPLIIVCAVILLIVNSSTALTGMALLLVLLSLPNKKFQRLCVYGILVFVLLFEIFVCFQGKGFENNELARWIIIDILGKDMTFTYRTDMWDSALRLFFQSPIIGFGFPDSGWYQANMSSLAVGPHNAILAVLIYGGIIALCIYVTILFLAIKRTAIYDDRFANVALGSLSVLSLMMLFEIYTIPFIFLLIVIVYFYPEFYKSTTLKKMNDPQKTIE